MTIQRALLIADSNGRPVWLPGDSTSNPNNPVFEPFYKDPIVGAFKSLHVSMESTGVLFVEFWKGNARVGAPTLLYPGLVVNIDADRVVPVGVRRAGEVWCMLSDVPGVFGYTRSDVRPQYRGVQTSIFPLTQISLYPGGPLSNVWCHPNSAPGAAAPMVCGTATVVSNGYLIGSSGYTAANWGVIYPVAFNVDPDTQNVVNVKRILSNVGTSPANIGTQSVEANTWDRLGILAIPSATNPNPALAPAVSFTLGFEGFNTYSRKVGFGYLGIGAGSELA